MESVARSHWKVSENRRFLVQAEFDGLRLPNPYGAVPLTDNDPGRPNEAYFEHVDWVVDRAEALGLYVGMLPTWGERTTK